MEVIKREILDAAAGRTNNTERVAASIQYAKVYLMGGTTRWVQPCASMVSMKTSQ